MCVESNVELLWLCFVTFCDWFKNSRHLLNQSDVKPKPIVTWSFAFSRAGQTLSSVMIGSLCCLRLLCLVVVIALVLFCFYNTQLKTALISSGPFEQLLFPSCLSWLCPRSFFRPYSLDSFDVYSKHFTVMNYRDSENLKQVRKQTTATITTEISEKSLTQRFDVAMTSFSSDKNKKFKLVTWKWCHGDIETWC